MIDTRLAKIKVSVVTGGTVVVNIRNIVFAAVATDCEARTSMSEHSRAFVQ